MNVSSSLFWSKKFITPPPPPPPPPPPFLSLSLALFLALLFTTKAINDRLLTNYSFIFMLISQTGLVRIFYSKIKLVGQINRHEEKLSVAIYEKGLLSRHFHRTNSGTNSCKRNAMMITILLIKNGTNKLAATV